MSKSLAVVVALFLPFFFLHSQSQLSGIVGVWKADPQKSKIAGPPVSEYLVMIEQKTVVIDRKTGEKATEIDELTGIKTEHGPSRSTLAFIPSGKPFIRPYQGVPTRVTASWQGNTLDLNAETAGRPATMKRIYELSPDGQTLTIQITQSGMGPGPEQHSTVVLLKQPDSAGEPLRQPEEVAETHYKNVKTSLKTLPASQFIDQMRYFAWSLGKNCEFCHVRGHFDSDEKEPKKTARQMITMTAAINAENFKDHPAVRCFTCHEMHNRPLSHPLFPDEAASMEKQASGPDNSGAPPRPNSSESPLPKPPE
jgi:hypothetical protein